MDSLSNKKLVHINEDYPEVVTDHGIRVKLVSQSKSIKGKPIYTFNVTYGLFIHAEFLRHRLLSRGVKSNRAIPTKTIRKEVMSNPYAPVFFGANQGGMRSDNEVRFKPLAKALWGISRYPAVFAHYLGEKLCKGHKEWLNRMLNPWQWVSETITATELDNLFNLRIHKDAQRDIREVVSVMHDIVELHKGSQVSLEEGEWHVPYVKRAWVLEPIPFSDELSSKMVYLDNNGDELSVDQAIKCSAARCARSSYNNHDNTETSADKDYELFSTLIESDPAHASPVEHPATPMRYPFGETSEGPETGVVKVSAFLEKGETAVDRKGRKWSGNFMGWVQYRQKLDNHVCENYEQD